VTELDYQKELLKARIEAHRTVLGLELRAAHTAFDPLGLALSLFGFDRSTVHVLSPILHAVASNLFDDDASEEAASTAETE
jgi:hypothetical protein